MWGGQIQQQKSDISEADIVNTHWIKIYRHEHLQSTILQYNQLR